jgi:hypothetical protein
VKMLLTALALCILAPSLAVASDPVLFHLGSGAPHLLLPSGRAMWSDPPDLNGNMASSEIISTFDLEIEMANDFIPTEPWIIHVTWWGGYFSNTDPCEPGIPPSSFNLRFYEASNCLPGTSIAEFLNIDGSEEFLLCQPGGYPIYQYEAQVLVQVPPGNRCWFSAQMCDHDYPPQWGRLFSPGIVECESAFRSAYWGFPDWVPGCAGDIFWPYDLSQEFEGSHSEACCFADGRCEYILTSICASQGGTLQGPDTACEPNPCASTPTRRSTWGSVRALYHSLESRTSR